MNATKEHQRHKEEFVKINVEDYWNNILKSRLSREKSQAVEGKIWNILWIVLQRLEEAQQMG